MKKTEIILLSLIVVSFLFNILFTLNRQSKMLNLVEGIIEFDESQVEVNRGTQEILKDIVEILGGSDSDEVEYELEGKIFEGEVIELRLQ